MSQKIKITLSEMTGELMIYLNWSANALMPMNPGAADAYLKEYRSTILKIAQMLLKEIGYIPHPIYRGILLKRCVNLIIPHERLQYLSFSQERAVADHFADVNGFGSQIMNWTQKLGEHGYVIQYTPAITEVLFHYQFFSILPYAEAFTLIGMDGTAEVESLTKQREIIILQPVEPFTNITRK